MSKLNFLAMSLLGAAVLAPTLPALAGPPAPVTITWGNRNKEVAVKAGQTFVVRLAANPSTGFQWYLLSGPNPFQLVGRKYQPRPARPGVVGAGGEEIFTFKATGAGSGFLRLYYIRPFEPNVAPETLWQTKINVAK